jgi:acetyl esterase/lipase
MRRALSVFTCFSLILAVVLAQETQDKPKPDLVNEKYGSNERNVFDLWKAKSDKPAPLVIFIHGGGFRNGSKEGIPAPLIHKCLEAGISVASINYRLTDVAPYPAQMLDSARAVQYLRLKAKEFNLDAKRFAAMGGSAGAGISLWLAFHNDLANKKAEDPVLRESTRMICALGINAQCSYDPRWIKKHIGGRAHETPALQLLFRVKPEELESDKSAKLYEDASPLNHLTKDDPPVRLIYTGNDEPSDKPGEGIHSRKFGEILKAEMEKIGLLCELSVGNGGVEDHVKFLVKNLKPKE